MNTIDLKSDLHNLIDRIDDQSTLEAIKAILSKQVQETDFWDELPQEVRESVQRGMKQAREGDTKSHEEVMKKYAQWL